MTSITSGLDAFDLHAGLSSLVLPDDTLDLGQGVIVRKTFARFLTPFVLANTETEEFIYPPRDELRTDGLPPLPPPAYWHLGRNLPIDVVVEIFVPKSLELDFGKRAVIADLIVFSLNLFCNSETTLRVLSNRPFNALVSTYLEGAVVVPVQFSERHFPLQKKDTPDVDPRERLKLVAQYWPTVRRLYYSSTEFRLAVDALLMAPFVQNSALTLISLWGALEAIFSPSTSELKFRVSSLIAAYTTAPGPKRVQEQRRIAALYDKRSAAAHGKPKHDRTHLFETIVLLRLVLILIIDKGSLPTKDELEEQLFAPS